MRESSMISDTLKKLLKLPAHDRADLALALWESLSADEQDAEFVLSDAQREELDRRLTEHDANPASGIPWGEIVLRHRSRR